MDRNSIVSLVQAFAFAAVALGISWLAVYFIAGPIVVSALELSAVFTSYACTFLFVLQKRIAYIVGVITTTLWSILFFTSGIPGLAMFNLYMIFSLAYGYWRWGPDTNSLEVDATIDKRDIINYTLIALGISALMVSVAAIFNWQITLLDFILTVFSGVAQIALDNKRKWNWYIWIFVNIISLWFFWNEGFMFVFVQYIYFLGNAIFALKVWNHGKTTNILMMNATPLHKGHEYCIRFFEQACAGSEGIIIFPSMQPKSEYEIAKLTAAERILLIDSNVEVVQLDLNKMTRAEPLDEHDALYWQELSRYFENTFYFAKHKFNFYSSEKYGKLLAHHIKNEFGNSTYTTIDPNRVFKNITGTSIREDLYGNFRHLANEIKPFFRENIIMFGAESVGKTTLARKIGAYSRNADVTDEWARPYIEGMNDKTVTPEVMEEIAKHQIISERVSSKMCEKPVLVRDTDIVSTFGYYVLKEMTVPTWVFAAALKALSNQRNTYYVLRSNNIPFEKDPLRYGGDVRESTDEFWYDLLTNHGAQNVHYIDATEKDVEKTIMARAYISIDQRLKSYSRPI